jgi:endonuclease III
MKSISKRIDRILEVFPLSRLPLDMARERLLKISGMGFKTADVILSVVRGGARCIVE